MTVSRPNLTWLVACWALGAAIATPVGFVAATGTLLLTTEERPVVLAVLGLGGAAIVTGWSATAGGLLLEALAFGRPGLHAPARLAFAGSFGLQVVPWLVLAAYVAAVVARSG